MKIPLVFGRPIQGVPSVLAAPAALAVAILLPKAHLPRQTRGLAHRAAAIPPPSSCHSELSPFKGWEIINSETPIGLGRHPIQRAPLSHDLSGRGDLLAGSSPARGGWQGTAMRVSGARGMVLGLIGLPERWGSIGNLISAPRRRVFQQPARRRVARPLRARWPQWLPLVECGHGELE
jgi:hypothetical protein